MPRLDRRELAAIFLGGAVGALLRVWLGEEFTGAATGWPWVTFAINVSGSFALGYLATRLQERLPQSTYRRPLLGTGFCGAYTTFSTMQVEILKMLEHGSYGLAVAYATASIAAGYLAIWVAIATVRRVRVIV
jgi:CrcB protein